MTCHPITRLKTSLIPAPNARVIVPRTVRKSLSQTALILAGSIAALLAHHSAQAAGPYYWDNAAGNGFGTAGGTWSGATAFWNTDGTGNAAAGGATTATTDAVNFGNGAAPLGADTITVGTASAGNITFASGSGAILLSGGTITLADTETITTDNTADTISSALTGAATSMTKAGTGTLTLSGLSSTAANNYAGTTILGEGTLAIATNDASFTGGLTFGTTQGSTTASALDLTSASATFAGPMLVQTNSGTANTITIGSGKALATNGNVTIGANSAAGTTTKLTVAGDVAGNGSWTVNNSGGTFQVGGASGSPNTNAATLDLSNLGTFTVNLGTTGVMRIGDLGTNTTGVGSTAILANTSTITTGTLNIGDLSGVGQSNFLKLGSGTQVINANTINIGLTATNRSTGKLIFNTGTGTLKVRAADGVSAANLTLLNSNSTTGSVISNLFDVTGHSADLLFGTVDIMNVTAAAGGTYNSTFSFDTGTLVIGTLKIGTKSSGAAGTLVQTAKVNIGSAGNYTNSATLGTVTMATVSATTTTGITSELNIAGTNTTVGITSLTVANNNAASGTATATGTVSISGGTTTVAGDIILAARSSSGTSSGTLDLTGGSLTVGGIIKVTGSGSTSTFNFDGGTLKPGSNTASFVTGLTTANVKDGGAKIDTNGFNITIGQALLHFAGATTDSLTKSGLGTLTLTGASTYNGGTNVNAGTLLWSGTNNLPTTGTLQVNAGGNFSLADGTARTTTTTAALGLASGANLTFDWNAGVLDKLTSTAAATTTGNVNIVINYTSPTGPGGTLISSASGGLTTANGTKYFLANNTNYTAPLTVTDTAVSIGAQTGVTAPTLLFWQGNKVLGTSTAGVDNALSPFPAAR